MTFWPKDSMPTSSSRDSKKRLESITMRRASLREGLSKEVKRSGSRCTIQVRQLEAMSTESLRFQTGEVIALARLSLTPRKASCT